MKKPAKAPKRVPPIKQLDYKVFTSNNAPPTTYRHSARSFGLGGFTKPQIEAITAQMEDMLRALLPDASFQIIPMGKGKFNVFYSVGNA